MRIEDLPLVDHHCHGVLENDLGEAEVGRWISESYLPPSPGCSYWDTPLGLLIRRWCAPLLDLEPLAPASVYVARRRELGAEDVNRRLLGAANVAAVVVDTGLASLGVCGVQRLGKLATAGAGKVIRLEAVAEEVAASGIDPTGYADALAERLEQNVRDAVAIKTVAAYRGGLELDLAKPTDKDVSLAARRWLRGSADGDPPRLHDPILIRHVLWTGIEVARDRGLVLQVHTGFGDPDLTLHRTDPSLLTPLLHALPGGPPVALLHTYPYHRHAGYLAAMFPHVYVDVGLALNHAGPSAPRILAELMELTPFHKQLYSSDAVALAELHYLGAMLFRRSLRRVLDDWTASGDIDAVTAAGIAVQVASGNARRIYPLDARHDRPFASIAADAA
jgi:uncharacterized protein